MGGCNRGRHSGSIRGNGWRVTFMKMENILGISKMDLLSTVTVRNATGSNTRSFATFRPAKSWGTLKQSGCPERLPRRACSIEWLFTSGCRSPGAEQRAARVQVCVGPRTGICSATNCSLFDHLVSGASSGDDISRPSALAVLRLITNSYSIGHLCGQVARLGSFQFRVYADVPPIDCASLIHSLAMRSHSSL
jgi:hypothetical protein